MNTDIAVQHAIDRLAKVGFDALSIAEATIAAAWLFEAGVLNDGFEKYYSSKRGDLAFHVPEALRLLGAMQLAQIAVEANAVFGSGGPPRDRDARTEMVRRLPASALRKFGQLEDRYANCEEDIDELMETFLGHADKNL